jgi:transcription factor AP-4
MSPNSQLEHEKRVRREIANSNERRRMQSINTGFQSLKILIPHSCGEKLSKVCYVYLITRFSKKKDQTRQEKKEKRKESRTND